MSWKILAKNGAQGNDFLDPIRSPERRDGTTEGFALDSWDSSCSVSPSQPGNRVYSMKEEFRPKIVFLSNVFDSHYHDLRGEKTEHTLLTASFRECVLRCLEMASGREVIVLSSPPKAMERRAGRWLPGVETKFFTHRQFFCANWDVSKLRIPLAWIFYARLVLRHVRSGDLVVIDNYEFLYIVAARLVHIFRRVKFVLVYLDGKHLIDHSWFLVLGWLAEAGGRGLLSGALLSTPALRKRLPDAMPKELVPGFVPDELPLGPGTPGGEVCFLYSGRLDQARGVDLLLAAMEHLPEAGWHLDITGDGPLAEQISRFSSDARWKGKVKYHQALPPADYERLKAACHVGLNCQRASDPISGVTLPSKVFTYLSAGLLVVSSKAGAVEQLCRSACFYYEEDTPQSLAGTMKEIIANYSAVRRKLDPAALSSRYSIRATAGRMRELLQAIGVVDDH
jgi:glycosyltransferase involved in cell wall biosynthesis